MEALKTVHKKVTGFTMVEMVVAVLLVAILGVAIFSRFNNPLMFNPSIARDNAIALALQAQQAALGRENVSFEIDPAGSDWQFSVSVSGVVIRTVTVPGANLVMEAGISGTCALALDDAITSNFRVTYNGLGNASGFTNSVSSPEPVGNGVRICVNDNVAYSACISPGGFAYQGDCDD